MKKLLLALAIWAGLSVPSFAALTATMFGVDSVQPAANGLVTISALVVVAGPEISTPIFEAMRFDIDLTQTTNQIQAALAAGIRAAVFTQFGQVIPVNGVNVMSFAKG